MDEVELIIAGIERELEQLRTEIYALADRLAAGENAVRAELNPAIRSEKQLMSNIHELKRAYQRFTQFEESLYFGEGLHTAPELPRYPQSIPIVREDTTTDEDSTPPDPLAEDTDDAARKPSLAELLHQAAAIEMHLRPELSVLTDDAVELMASAYADPMGVILQSRTYIGVSIESNGRQFAENGDPRSEARWRAALRVLEDLDLVENLRGTRTQFELTLGGYRVAGVLHRGARQAISPPGSPS